MIHCSVETAENLGTFTALAVFDRLARVRAVEARSKLLHAGLGRAGAVDIFVLG